MAFVRLLPLINSTSMRPVSTADFGYMRLRRPDYTADDLAAWCARIREQPWEEAYVFFKHEDVGGGPRLAAELAGVFARRA